MRQTRIFFAFLLIVQSRGVAAQQPATELVPSRELRLVVADAGGAPLPGVTVTVLRDGESETRDWRLLKDEGRLKVADASGRVEFQSSMEGSCDIRLQLTGFLSETIGPVSIGKPCVRLPQLRVVLPSWTSTCF